jgi:hypothetical protein
VVAIRRSARTLIDLGLVEGESDTSAWSPYLMRVILNATLRRDETWGGRLERFLESTDALYEPAALPRYDVFISFASVDFIAASNLSLQLKSRGHRCFLANSTIRAGQLWADELRDALQTSRGVVVVASAHTVESTWVLGEIGAAWAIGIPLLLGTIDAAQELVSPVRALGTECLPLADLDGLSARIAGWRS